MFRVRAGLLLGMLAALAAGLVLIPADRMASAQPAGKPAGLRYVPADAALFVHADAAKIWSGDFGKAIRGADTKLFGEVAKQATEIFGMAPETLDFITVFMPQLKQPRDTESVGLIFEFNQPYDRKKLEAGFGKAFGKGTKNTFHTPSDRVAVLLVGLDEKYARPQPAGATGPLSSALQEAASGKHAIVAASTLASLPDELRGDDLPPDARAFQPLFKAESMMALVGLDKEFTLEVRVKTKTAAQAIEAEKALGAVGMLLEQGLDQAEKMLAMDDAKDPLTKDLLTLVKAAQTGVKGAKYTTNGTESRVRVAVPNNVPIGSAALGAIRKVRQAAARVASSNNLKQIALALHNYHDTHGSFPPAAVCDKTGKPMLSWRVLILPYIEQANLYKEFKLDEAWDGPNNKKLIAKMPKTYMVPDTEDALATKTFYRVFVGNGALFDYLRGPKITDITDGTSNTIMVITAAEAVTWTKPDELAFDPEKDMTKLMGTRPSNDVCMVAMGDGSVRAISTKISKKTFHDAITRSGGEVLGDDF